MKKFGFTLAEVLITLGIIGVVAAITLPVIITNIQNRGYVERMKKAYSAIQNVTNQIIYEDGTIWVSGTASIDENNKKAAEKYASKLNVAKDCGYVYFQKTDCNLLEENYKSLNGSKGLGFSPFYKLTYMYLLSDSTVVGLRFRQNENATFWGNPDLTFVVDVNGSAKPNQIGRDIFYFYYDNEKIRPYGFAQTDDCSKDGLGSTCAYKIITEGKMNY